MNREEILKFLNDNKAFKEGKLSSGITTLIKNKYPSFVEDMKKVTGIDDNNISRLIWHIVNGNEIPRCPICGNILEFKNYGEGYKKGCSKECLDKLRGKGNLGKKLSKETKQKMKQTCIDKYGVDNPFKSKEVQEKIKQTNLEKYGVEIASQSETIKEKTKQTNLIKYGANTPLQNKDILKKMENTNLLKYGFKSSMSNKEVREKARQTNLERYGTEWATSSNIVKEKAALNRMKSFYEKLFTTDRLSGVTPLFTWEEYEGSKAQFYKFKCNKCGQEFEDRLINGRIPLCTHCYPRNVFISGPEKEVLEFVKSIYNEKIIENDRKLIYPQELDIYIPDKKIAIEFDGLFFHSSFQKDKNYHLDKTLKCEEKGIRLLHIFSDEWYYKKEIIKSIIKASLGIYERKIGARECEVRDVEINEAKEFLEENHLQGYAPSSIRKGLYYKDELVSIITFTKPRFNRNYNWELVRYCNKINTQIIGGFERLFNHANIKGSIITYSDRRLFTGNVYRKLFKEEKPTEPNFYYIKDDFHKYSRLQFQKEKLTEDHPEYENLTEKQITQILGYYRIYDCGNWKFTLN